VPEEEIEFVEGEGDDGSISLGRNVSVQLAHCKRFGDVQLAAKVLYFHGTPSQVIV
jgi:hypothetical protein